MYTSSILFNSFFPFRSLSNNTVPCDLQQVLIGYFKIAIFFNLKNSKWNPRLLFISWLREAYKKSSVRCELWAARGSLWGQLFLPCGELGMSVVTLQLGASLHCTPAEVTGQMQRSHRALLGIRYHLALSAHGVTARCCTVSFAHSAWHHGGSGCKASMCSCASRELACLPLAPFGWQPLPRGSQIVQAQIWLWHLPESQPFLCFVKLWLEPPGRPTPRLTTCSGRQKGRPSTVTTSCWGS